MLLAPSSIKRIAPSFELFVGLILSMRLFIVSQISLVICWSVLDSKMSLSRGYLFSFLFNGGLQIGFQLNLNLLRSSNVALFCSSFIKLFISQFNSIGFNYPFFN